MGHSALAGVADRVTDNLLESVDRLVVEGGATRLLVADLPDMSLFPDAANGDSKSPDQVAAYRKLAVMHNDRLRAKLGRFRNNHSGGDIDIRLLPFAASTRSLVDDAACLGTVPSDVGKACLKGEVACDDPFSRGSSGTNGARRRGTTRRSPTPPTRR